MTELLVRESNLPTITDPQVWAERRRAFNDWVNKQLREGVDYGKMPGLDKATLLKPGAEKIAQAYGCSPITEVTVRDQDPNTGYLYVEVAVRLVNIQSGAVIATGLGSCCSYESKYRYRWEWWNERSKPTEAGWEETRSHKWRRRVQNPDLVDQWNTVLKMAKKRALVDAALTVSGASEKFTQDVEDFDEGPAETVTPETVKAETPMAETAKPIIGDTQHWIDNGKARAAFWKYTADTLSLTNAQVYEALGVEKMHDYRGTMAECKAALEKWIAAQALETEAIEA